MRTLAGRLGLLLLLGLSFVAAPAARAEEPSTTTKLAIEPEFAASGFQRFWLGSGYRDLWTTPVTLPVLDLRRYAGGLTPVRRVGGLQTPGLALTGADGRAYTFRSLRKEPDRSLPPEWRGSWAAWIVRDHTSSNHPGAALLLPPLAEAAGLMHTEPQLVVMPNDSLLGSFRTTFAGLPGTIEEYPRAGGDSIPSFHGATEIIHTRELWKRWLEGPENRIDSRAFLRARILDLYVSNWDRHRDQWRWARIPGDDVWEPLPEDPDMAFVKNDGAAVAMARGRDPKLVQFHGDFDRRLEGDTINGSEMDRWLLTDLDRAAFEEVVRDMQSRFTDDVIAQSIRQLPAEWHSMHADLAAALRARRGKLANVVMHYYENLATAVDIHATDRDEVVSVRRLEGGVLEVDVALAGETKPYYHRRFVPSETHEVRIYLHGGDDRVERTGPAGGPILVRVIAGAGADKVDDSASGETEIWKGTGTLTKVAGRGTCEHGAWSNPEPDSTAPWLEPRNWGHWTMPVTEIAYGTDVGVVLGAGVTRTEWGFRSYPEEGQQELVGAWSTGENRGRLTYRGTFRGPASPRALRVDALASGMEQVYFFGFGNENTVPADRNEYRTGEQLVSVHPALLLQPSPSLQLDLGATFRASWSPTDRNNILNAVEPYGVGTFEEAGLRAGLELDSRRSEQPSPLFEYHAREKSSVSANLRVDGFYMPPILDVDRSFGGLEGEAVSYVGRDESRAQLGVRAGAKRVWGDHPWFESAFLGGRSTLAGYTHNRYAGDTSLYGGIETRVWLFSMKMVPVPCRFGVLGLAEGGRVWFSTETSDTWHGSWGAGAMIQPVASHFALSGTYAKSPDETKFYLTTRATF